MRTGQNRARPALLAGIAPELRVLALAAALEMADDSEVEAIAGALVRELQPPIPGRFGWIKKRFANPEAAPAAAMKSLVRHWARLPRAVRVESLQLGSERGVAAVAGSRGHSAATVRESLVRYAAESGRIDLLDVVLEGVVDEDQDVAAAAEESLVAMCGEIAGRGDTGERMTFDRLDVGDWAMSQEGRATLRGKLAALCEVFPEHRRRGVLVAALAMLEPGVAADPAEALASWFADGTQPSLPAMRSMLRRSGGTLTRLRAWEWLRWPAVSAAAAERVARAETVEEHEVVLCSAHLLENPARAARWAAVPAREGDGGPLPTPERVADLSVNARRGLARLAAGIGGGPGCVEHALSPLLTDQDGVVRLCAVAALPGASVLDYCFDRDSHVALSASLKWVHTARAGATEWERVARNLARSPHPSVRILAEEVVRSASPPSARVGGVDAGRDELVECIRGAIRSGDQDASVSAIALARKLGVQREFEGELLGLIAPVLGGSKLKEQESRVISAAVSALSELPTRAAVEAVQTCLERGEGRVKSNAAEGLMDRFRGRGDLPFAEPRLYESLMELKSDAHHRVRASVLRGILRAASPDWGGTGYEPVVADELVRMLEDERPMHRVAGLWAVERVTACPGESVARRWDRLASLVAGLARDETDDAVQRRAMWCARRMLANAADQRGELRRLVQETAA